MTDPENETVYFLKSSLAAGETPVFHFTDLRARRTQDIFRIRSQCGYRLRGFDTGCRHTLDFAVPVPRRHAERIGRPCRRCKPVENGTQPPSDARSLFEDVWDVRLAGGR